ncbi:MAG: hypothetical protein ACRCTY_04890 [Candidatus Adiutrix sp.]
MNLKSFLARAIMLAATLFFLPVGAFVLSGAFNESQPHFFVMLVFSGSLTLLLGLVGLIGFVASFTSKGASADKTSDKQ